jgi:hypothetical protein
MSYSIIKINHDEYIFLQKYLVRKYPTHPLKEHGCIKDEDSNMLLVFWDVPCEAIDKIRFFNGVVIIPLLICVKLLPYCYFAQHFRYK